MKNSYTKSIFTNICQFHSNRIKYWGIFQIYLNWKFEIRFDEIVRLITFACFILTNKKNQRKTYKP